MENILWRKDKEAKGQRTKNRLYALVIKLTATHVTWYSMHCQVYGLQRHVNDVLKVVTIPEESEEKDVPKGSKML